MKRIFYSMLICGLIFACPAPNSTSSNNDKQPAISNIEELYSTKWQGVKNNITFILEVKGKNQATLTMKQSGKADDVSSTVKDMSFSKDRLYIDLLNSSNKPRTLWLSFTSKQEGKITIKVDSGTYYRDFLMKKITE